MAQKQTQREILRAQREEKSKKRATGLVIGALVLIIAIALVYFLPRLLNTSKVESYANQNGRSVGDPNAPVMVIEYSNFGCSHCRTFTLEKEAQFIKDYVDTGKVYYTFSAYQFSEDTTMKAAEAAYCAGEQNFFFQMQHVLFENSTYSGAFADSNINTYAKNLGLDMSRFNQCLADDTQLDAIRTETAAASSLGVTGTPTFNVNGTLVYSNTLDETILAALAAAGK